MFTLIAENAKGDKLQLTQNPVYGVIDISGLNPAGATINTSVISTNDGSMFNSSRVNQRNIVITIVLLREPEANRIALYKIFKTKQFCRLYFKNGARDVFIEGYVETFECSLFAMSEQVQISVICPNPYFKSTHQSTSYMALTESLFEFPFSIPATGIPFSNLKNVNTGMIYNGGDITSGMEITLSASSEVINPKIINFDTREFFELYQIMQAGDVIHISTYNGEKSVTLTRNGVTTNIINAINRQSTWLQLTDGENNFLYSASEGDDYLEVTITHTDLYEGV